MAFFYFSFLLFFFWARGRRGEGGGRRNPAARVFTLLVVLHVKAEPGARASSQHESTAVTLVSVGEFSVHWR